MKYNPLGSTGVRVSALALGSATFGVAPLQSDAARLVGRALDLGINLFDCANSYGNQPRFDRPGVPAAKDRASAEEILGAALKGKRDEVVLCSKVMEPVGSGVNDWGLSRLHMFNQLEKSLKRLGTDHLDVYYAHHPDDATPLEETLRAFDDMIRQGKIRYCALSTYQPTQMVEALWIAERLGMSAPVANQVPYNLAKREHERDLIPACKRLGTSLTCFSPLNGGLFGGPEALKREFQGHARWGGPGFPPAQLELAAELQKIADESGYSSPQLALAWLVAQPAVAAAIIGPETIEELEAACASIDLDVSKEIMDAVDAVGKLDFFYY